MRGRVTAAWRAAAIRVAIVLALALGPARVPSLGTAGPEQRIREPALPPRPGLVSHRGLPGHAPENPRAGFAACLALRLGFELDVRRTRDGHLDEAVEADVVRLARKHGVLGRVVCIGRAISEPSVRWKLRAA